MDICKWIQNSIHKHIKQLKKITRKTEMIDHRSMLKQNLLFTMTTYVIVRKQKKY